MLKRLYDQKLALTFFFDEDVQNQEDQALQTNDLNVTVANLETSEWKVVSELIAILQPVDAVTESLSAANYASISLLIPTILSLECDMKSVNVTSPSVRHFRNVFLSSIQTRFANIETHPIMTLASILDPRVKDSSFTLSDHRRLATNRILNELEKSFQHTFITDFYIIIILYSYLTLSIK
jgi:hypothetical protein